MDGSGPAVPPRTKVTAEAVRTRKLELNLPDATSQQSAAAWFRGVLRLPDELKQNCVDDIVDLMPRFVELLSSEHQAVVTPEPVCATHIASVSSIGCDRIGMGKSAWRKGGMLCQ
jgi:hypothetical protein